MAQTTTEALEVTDEAVRIDEEGIAEGTIVVYVAAGTVEWGGPDVTYGTGIPVEVGEKEYFDLAHQSQVWLVCAEGQTADVRVGKGGQ